MKTPIVTLREDWVFYHPLWNDRMWQTYQQQSSLCTYDYCWEEHREYLQENAESTDFDYEHAP